MDHYVELASTDGVVDAIRLVIAQADQQKRCTRPLERARAHRARAEKLLVLHAFLAEENASIWVAELVRAFYQRPSFASYIWINLRYCTAALEPLADYVLANQ